MKKQYRKMKLWLCLLVSAVFVGVILYVVLSAAHRENKRLLSEIEDAGTFMHFYYINSGDIDWDKVLQSGDVEREKMLLSMAAYFNSLKIESNILPYRAGQGVDAVKYCAVVNSDGKVYHFPANCLEITEVTTVSVDGEDEKQLTVSSNKEDDRYPEFGKYPGCYYVPIPDDVMTQITNDLLEGKIDGNRYYFNGRITGVREGHIVFVQTLELPATNGNGTITYKVSYAFPEAPKNGTPFVFDNLGEDVDYIPNMVMSAAIGYLDNTDKQAICELHGNLSVTRPVNGETQADADRRRAETNKENAEKTEDAIAELLEKFDINSREWIEGENATYWDPGLFTSRWYTTSSVGYDTSGWMPNYFLCYEVSPLSTALHQTKTSLIALCAIWAAVIAIILLLVQLLQKRHEKFEKSRVTLTRAAAHELKTPLAVLKTYAENWNDLSESDRADCAKDMESRIDYVNGLVGNILELSRLESDAKEMHPETIALPELNAAVLSQLSAISEGKNISVNAPANAADASVTGDLSMLRTVITNLVTNAVRYGDRKIVIDIAKKKDAVRYQITNDGAPIPASKLPHIWDAFYSADESRAKSGKDCTGTGLGLAITKQILELHKAKYGCTSDESGTTFYFEM